VPQTRPQRKGKRTTGSIVLLASPRERRGTAKKQRCSAKTEKGSLKLNEVTLAIKADH
jgi:hypothetical protein